MQDREIDELRERVDCRTVLERAGWELDKAESTQNAAKFRNGPAKIVIVTHEGRGWFDPINDRRGDVIALAQHVWGGNIGQARVALRPLAGIRPELVARSRERERRKPEPLNAPRTWERAHMLAPSSQGWRYLVETRSLPEDAVERATAAGVLREGIYGTVWALHRSSDGLPCGWEMRGPQYKGFAKGGDKALFWVGELASARRIAVTESAIDALSLAAIEGWADGTAYVSTGGGFGPPTNAAFDEMISPRARIVAATDRGEGGDLLADRLHGLARETCRGFSRLRPRGKDWNAQLQERTSTIS